MFVMLRYVDNKSIYSFEDLDMKYVVPLIAIILILCGCTKVDNDPSIKMVLCDTSSGVFYKMGDPEAPKDAKAYAEKDAIKAGYKPALHKQEIKQPESLSKTSSTVVSNEPKEKEKLLNTSPVQNNPQERDLKNTPVPNGTKEKDNYINNASNEPDYVFVAPLSGKKYHKTQDCRGLKKNKKVEKISIKDAHSQGYEPCKICY